MKTKHLKTSTVMKLFAQSAIEHRKTVPWPVNQVQDWCAEVANRCKTVKEARQECEEFWTDGPCNR